MHSKERLLSIGQYPEVSLAKARKAKALARIQVADGIDPSEAKQEAKALSRTAHGNTFDALGRAFLKKHRIEGKPAQHESIARRLQT
jgi:hypothetical protein